MRRGCGAAQIDSRHSDDARAIGYRARGMDFLSQITPVLLTWNEAPNLQRSLAPLAWAREIVVVDSGSTDATRAILAAQPRVRVVERAFDSHAEQWRFAVEQTGIATAWELRLDADYVLSARLVEELRRLQPSDDVAAYRIAFDYCIGGRRLRASLYPPNTVLFRRGRAAPWQDGHTERWRIDGKVAALQGRIAHDDRKPVESWLTAQARYQKRERDKLLAADRKTLRRKDRLRLRHWIAPPAVFLWCLFGRGMIFDGRAGLAYAYQRALAETALALYLLEARAGGQR
jgi:glycosyltransferase involved in cell wall biosynthesis